MKKCPQCNAEVEDNFEICWNCQYSFVDGKILENNDFQLLCPSCNTAVDSSFEECPGCGQNLSIFKSGLVENQEEPRNIDCLRCNLPMAYQGNFKFHEGTRTGVLGNLFELFTNREEFILYCCPNCGKVEFFLPGFIN